MKHPPGIGQTFLELMAAILILSIIFLYIVPVFLSSSRYSFQQKESLRASLFAQAFMERIRENSRLYQPPCVSSCPPPLCTLPFCSSVDPYDFYTNLEYLYNVSSPSQPALFNGTFFDPVKSYVVACPEGGCSGATGVPALGSTVSKEVVIHLEWNTPPGESQPTRGSYTIVARVARPPGWFPLSPQVSSTTSSSTTSSSTTSTSSTSTSSTSTSSTSSTSTSSTSTSLPSTSTTTSTSTSSSSTSSTSTTSTSTSSTSSTSTSSTSTSSTSTSSTSTSSTSSTLVVTF